MWCGKLVTAGVGYSVMTPKVVSLATLPASVNQRLPSGPAVMPSVAALGGGGKYSVKAPAVVTLATLPFSVTQRFPSGPAAIPEGLLLAVGVGHSVRTRPCGDWPAL